MTRRFRRQRAEHRQRHVDTVEAVDVVLPVTACGRPAHPVLCHLNAGGKPHEVAVVGPQRHAANDRASYGVGKGRLSTSSNALANDDELLDGVGRRRGVQFETQDRRLVE